MSKAKFKHGHDEKYNLTKYHNLPESSYFALFIRTISLSQTKRANNSAKNNNNFLKKKAKKKAM